MTEVTFTLMEPNEFYRGDPEYRPRVRISDGEFTWWVEPELIGYVGYDAMRQWFQHIKKSVRTG